VGVVFSEIGAALVLCLEKFAGRCDSSQLSEIKQFYWSMLANRILYCNVSSVTAVLSGYFESRMFICKTGETLQCIEEFVTDAYKSEGECRYIVIMIIINILYEYLPDIYI